MRKICLNPVKDIVNRFLPRRWKLTGFRYIVDDWITMSFYLDGSLHRDGDFPADLNYRYDTVSYYKHGVCHRENGPAVIVLRDLKFHVFRDDSLHTFDVATEQNWREQIWVWHGKCHRVDGPAKIQLYESESVWVLGGRELKGDFADGEIAEWFHECGISHDWRDWSADDEIMIRLRFQ